MTNRLKWWSRRGVITAMGIAIGAGIGAATDQMAVWTGIGAAIGAALEFTMARTSKD